jgi:hydrogenase expression/formation protein HypD
VLPRGRIDSAIELTRANPDVILCTYADLMRVPGSNDLSLLKAKANGADIRMVYSPDDALRLAVENPARRVVFLAIGFETTAPATASVLLDAQVKGIPNFFI